MRRVLAGAAVGIGSAAVLGAVLVPLRSHLSIATVGLIMVVPVVAGVATGGLAAGAAAVAAGFLIYDFVYIPPYYTLTVGAAQNWVALAVYAVVMLLVARIVSRLQVARADAQARAAGARRLLELSELLVTDRALDDLLQSVVDTVHDVFGVAGVGLLLPVGDHLEVAAAAGRAPTAEEVRRLQPDAGLPVAVGTGPAAAAAEGVPLRALALSATGRPVGLLAVRGLPRSGYDRDLLQTFANSAALAIERGQLRDQALRSELLEEVDRVRQGLLGAVSHDLRTPLATMKVAASTLLDSEGELDTEGRHELYGLLDSQTDRLTRLVSGLLDINRYEAGALEVRPEPADVVALIEEARDAVAPAMEDRFVPVDVADGLPKVVADRLLIGQVLVNLLDNADRHGPPGTPVTVTGRAAGSKVRIAVEDRGPGVPVAERETVFERFLRSDSGGRAGLGLWICRTFVEAHGQRIWVEDVPGGGARFVFTLESTEER